MARLHTSKKSRYGDDDVELLMQVSAGTITKETLSEKLAKHVEQVCCLQTKGILVVGSWSNENCLRVSHASKKQQWVVCDSKIPAVSLRYMKYGYITSYKSGLIYISA